MSPFEHGCGECCLHIPLNIVADASTYEKYEKWVEELKKFKFSTLSSEVEDWCRKCNPNLPPHKHWEDSSCVVKDAEGSDCSAKVFGWLHFRGSDGRQFGVRASCLFKGGFEPLLLGKPLPPMADAAALLQFLSSFSNPNSCPRIVAFATGDLPSIETFIHTLKSSGAE